MYGYMECNIYMWSVYIYIYLYDIITYNVSYRYIIYDMDVIWNASPSPAPSGSARSPARPGTGSRHPPAAAKRLQGEVWLVVFTILKNISQWEGLSHILWKIKKMFETTNQM